jgi:hypothetical protein
MKMTRKAAEKRQQAVLDFFLRNPAATGDEAQLALSGGKLTGEKGPTMSVGMLYSLRKRALSMLPAGGSARVVDSMSGDQLAKLRERARELQEMLAKLPDVSGVTITRDGARVVRTKVEEEAL